MCPEFEQLCPTRRPLPRSYTRSVVWIAAAEFETQPSVVCGSRLNCWPFALHCFRYGTLRDGVLFLLSMSVSARTHAHPPPPQNLGAGPPPPRALRRGRLSPLLSFPAADETAPWRRFAPDVGHWPKTRRGTLGRARIVSSAAARALLGWALPSPRPPPPRSPARARASASFSASFSGFAPVRSPARASASASAVKVVRSRSARLRLTSTGGWLSRANSCRRSALAARSKTAASWRSWAAESDTAGRGSAWLPALSRRGSARLPAPSRCSAWLLPARCGSAWLPARPALSDSLVWLAVSITKYYHYVTQ